MQTPQEHEQPPASWLPIHGHTVVGKVLADYNPSTNEIAVKRRWHGTNIRAVGRLPERDPACDEWVPVVGRDFRVRLCYYNPAKHQVKISFKRYGAWIEERIKLPNSRAPADPESPSAPKADPSL